MTLAQKLHQEPQTATVAPAITPAEAPAPKGFKGELVRVASIYTVDGRLVTSGIATLAGTSSEWTAKVDKLDRPGNVASLFFSRGQREVRLRLDDGRSAPGADHSDDVRGRLRARVRPVEPGAPGLALFSNRHLRERGLTMAA